jgi:O-antigen ligase
MSHSPPSASHSEDRITGRVLFVACWLSAALMGIYHNPDRLGVEIYDFELTVESLKDQEDTDDQVQIGTMQKQISFAVLAALGVYLFVTKRRDEWQPGPLAWWIALCLGWACATYLWSYEAPVTLRELLRLLVAALVAFGIAKNFTPQQATFLAVAVMLASVTLALGGEIALGYLRPWDSDYRLQGGMHANMVAVHAGFLALACQARLKIADRKNVYRLLLALGVVALLLTKSRTGLAAYGVGAAVLWSIQLEPRRAAGYWAVGSGLLTLALLAVAIGGPSFTRALLSTTTMGRQVESASLTGRVPLWRTVAHDIARRPLTGYGYEAFWTAQRREAIAHDINWYPTDAHSIYINTLLEQGFIGFALSLTVVVWGGWTLLVAFRRTEQIGFAFFAALTAYLLFHGITEAGCSAARISGLFIGTGLFYAAGWPRPELSYHKSPHPLPAPDGRWRTI